jgi:hypothetical protein
MKQGLDFVRSSGAAFLAANAPPLVPLTISSVKRWYRLAASTPVSGEYSSVTEVLGGTAIVQTDADRNPAAATAANGLPVATFDGSDVWLQTLESGNNGTDKWWLFFWIKPADFGATQQLYTATASGLSGSASVSRVRVDLAATSGKVSLYIFSSTFSGRNYLTAGNLTAAAWNCGYIQYDNSKTNECDTTGSDADAKVRIAIGTTFQALTPSDFGSGGVPTQLASATGSVVLGGANDSDTPVSPLRNGGQLGPNLYNGDTSLTTAELAAIVGFEVPT